ncbi:MAG: MmgE/PrpD family protein [Betaproteobacteria bacterium]|nr:MmgE/PrpD family protein [Betaproteobacteria bacterium]
MLPMTPNPSTQLARFLCALNARDVPQRVFHEASRALVNYFAVALAASNDLTIEKALRVLLPFGSGEQASLVGRRERCDMLNTAAINAMAANVYDFDDTHIPSIVHPTAPVAAALFALAETHRVSGKKFLTALIAGIEIECRIANAISPAHYARGWHITSTCGIFGAAAAAAKVLDLDERQIVWALGNAAAQSAGLVETLGTSAKSISVGNAARNGLLSALLAQAGFEGPAQPLDGPFGFLKVVGENIRWEALAGATPARWQIECNTYKPYPCGVVLNPVIDACLALASHADFQARGARAIARVEITGHPLLRQRTDRPAVDSGRLSQVCAQHAVGVTLTRQRAGLPEFSDAAVADAAVRALGAKVAFVDDASMRVDAARLRVTFEDKHALAIDIDAARGSLANPLSDADLETKLRTLNRDASARVNAQPLIEALWGIAQCADAGAIMALATTPSS